MYIEQRCMKNSFWYSLLTVLWKEILNNTCIYTCTLEKVVKSQIDSHIFSSPDPKGQVSYCHHWVSVVCRSFVRPSVNFSHFNQLLWSHRANLNQTLVEWSLDGPLPKLCPMIPTSNQDGRQAKNRKKGDEILIVHCCFSISQNELKF